MKTITKVILLLFGITQLVFILYLSIPCIPRKIANEKLGLTYSFGPIAFDLLSEDYTEVLEIKEKLIERRDDPSKIMVLKNNNGNTITIIDFTQEVTGSIDSSPVKRAILLEPNNVFLNLFKHRFAAKKIDSDSYKYSERIEQDGYMKTRYTVYKGNDKMALISSVTDKNRITKHYADIKINNFYFSVVPHQPDTDNSIALGNIMEFIRTVNVQLVKHQN